ncbi:hypothetical protein B0J11DRAFT_444025 [Dendryphion nanum]|uniref:Uncharacterized protein n=1 Tax=Dendryphion nanum TaxID=256645 RepID=A0A9P9DBV0_9PLEO|nr:hypothetical protein B0J11DRAFT_444025 [Dendryphion nanum]
MKRKREQSLDDTVPSKKSTIDLALETRIKICPLIKILTQYGLLSCIASYLVPRDLFALAATSKAALEAIFPRPESRKSLLKKTLCEGKGIAIRVSHHQKSPFFYTFDCKESVQCGTQADGIEVRPCSRCNTNTCDECRIHCVYQSIHLPAEEPDELDAFSGFALLHSHEMGILSEAHLNLEAAPWTEFRNHDQGYLDLPLTSSVFAAPVNIEELINVDLGSRPLTITYSSGTPHPSPVIKAFWEITEQRKRSLCEKCFDQQSLKGRCSRSRCRCTLKGRFLNRWLCLGCFQEEEKQLKSSTLGIGGFNPTKCGCGTELNENTTKTVCLWCCGTTTNQ